MEDFFIELTLDEKLDCVLLDLNGNLPLHTILKKEELMQLDLSIVLIFTKNEEKLLSRRKMKEEHTTMG